MIRARTPNSRAVVIAVALLRALLSRMLRSFLTREFVPNPSRAFAGIEVLGVLGKSVVLLNSAPA